MWTEHKNRNIIFILLIVLIAILIGFIAGVEFDNKISINQTQSLNINTNSNISRININTSTKKELQLLSGIGEVKADKIIKNRPYDNISSLINIIGEKTYNNIKDEVEVY